jgi:allantoinase
VFAPDLIVRGRRVVTPRGTRPAAVHIRNGRVIGVLEFDDVPPGVAIDEAAGVVLPGVVDAHVHVRGSDTIGAGFAAATRAAAAGGVTTIVNTPDAVDEGGPPVTSVGAFEARRRAADGRSFVDVGFWGALVPDNLHELSALFAEGVLGFECHLLKSAVRRVPGVPEPLLRQAMPGLTRIGATLLAHAELDGRIEAAGRVRPGDPRSRWQWPWATRPSPYAAYLESHPKQAENDAVALLIQLCREYRTRTHVVHLSSSDALTPLYHARAARLPVTADTCPHYLYLVAEEAPDDRTAFRCAPPIRERENREFLWAALANGLLQMIASDHVPSTPTPGSVTDRDASAMESQGVASVQLALPVVWTEARARGYTIDQVVEWMCRAPSQLPGLARKGRIEVGCDADLVIFDPEAAFRVDRTLLLPDHALTPYAGRHLYGVVERTYLRGTRVYERGRGWSAPRGNFLLRERIREVY